MPSMGQRATGKRRRSSGRGAAGIVVRAARAVGMEPLEGRVMLSAEPAVVPVVWQGQARHMFENQYVVETRNGGDFAAAAQRLNLPVSNVRSLGGGGFYGFETAAPAKQVARWARKYGGAIKELSPNFAGQVQSIPNDPLFPNQWHLQNTGQFEPDPTIVNGTLQVYANANGVPGVDIDAPLAWDITTGSKNVVIGVLDSGIDLHHPDLQPNIFTNSKDIPGNGIDDDNNGFIDDVHGWDFFDGENDASDENGHGTHVSGIIGAVANNGIGVSGVSPNVTIVPIKIGNAIGQVSFEAAIEGLNYLEILKREGVDVVATNNSYGGPDFPFDRLFADAVSKAGEQGILFVSAAGNDTANNDRNFDFPAKFAIHIPTAITVSATDNSDLLATFSNVGLAGSNVGSPGTDILSTTPTYPVNLTTPTVIPGFGTFPAETTPDYGYLSGTSQASPVVAGILALEKAANPGASALQLKQALFDGVEQIAALQGRYSLPPLVSTGGRVNARNAVMNVRNIFANMDPYTQGSWIGRYGTQGAFIAGSTDFPSFVTVNTTGASMRTVAGPTSDPRAMQLPDGSTRTVGYLSSQTSFKLDMNFTDGQRHRMSVYATDFEGLGRTETIQLVDPDTGRVLAGGQTATNFSGGQIFSWDVAGRVQLVVTNVSGQDAVISGILFDAAPATPAAFVGADPNTHGAWRNNFGSQAAYVPGQPQSFPPSVGLAITGATTQFVPVRKKLDPLVLEAPVASKQRPVLAYITTPNTMDITVDPHDTNAHRISLYVVDADTKPAGRHPQPPRAERIDVLDANSGALLFTQDVTNFQGGQYLTYQVTGPVTFHVTRLAGSSAVVSGIFMDDVPGSGTRFVGTDVSTHGNWTNVYGSDGAFVVGEPGAAFPSFVTVNVTSNGAGGQVGVVAAQSSDQRALVQANNPFVRTVGYFRATQFMTVDMDFSDVQTHRVSFYFVDFERNSNRAQRVELVDPTTGQVFSREDLYNFQGGKYLTYDLRGHVQLRITRLAGVDAVLSGIFFD